LSRDISAQQRESYYEYKKYVCFDRTNHETFLPSEDGNSIIMKVASRFITKDLAAFGGANDTLVGLFSK
jgi:hypothetical protein